MSQHRCTFSLLLFFLLLLLLDECDSHLCDCCSPSFNRISSGTEKVATTPCLTMILSVFLEGVVSCKRHGISSPTSSHEAPNEVHSLLLFTLQ